MTINLNRTIMNFFTFTYKWSQYTTEKYDKEIQKNLEKIMKYFFLTLIRNSSQKILLINQAYLEAPFQGFFDIIPEGMKYHIDVIDKKQRNLDKIIRFVEPIVNDLDVHKKHRSLIRVVDFFNKLSLGCKYKAEIEIDDFKNLGYIFSELRMKLSDDEALYRLNTLNGIYNLYTYKDNIDTITLKRSQYELSIEKRVKKILLESDVIDSSHQRHLFGIPYLFKKARLKYNSDVKRILQNPNISNLVNFSKDMILTSNGIPPNILPNIPNISKYERNSFNPPIISLKKYRKITLRELFPHNYKKYENFYIYKDLREESFAVAENVSDF